MAVEAHTGALPDGLPVRWLTAPGHGAPVVYVHGVPDSADVWRPFLERTGGIAVDLAGFGESGKPAHQDYSIAGQGRFLEQFLELTGVEDFNLVLHGWGAVALELAQRRPERVERLVLIDAVPLTAGYSWHRIARAWRTPVLGELVMGSLTRPVLKWVSREATAGQGPLPDEQLDAIIRHFDHGTQRAILKLYRSAPPEVLQHAGNRLGELRCPALVLWGERDPYIDPGFAAAYVAALGGSAEARLIPGAGHWPWLQQPTVIEQVAAFLAA